MLNKKKIVNDPVYGFINIQYEIIFDLLSHPYFQRLRNIKQCAMTHFVYPGAMHTRFHHALGATHLMCLALETLRSKGHDITDEEAEAVTAAILLHDIGHGPFSHALENCIIENVHHETISALIMDKLNEEFNGRLSLAIEIFNDRYHKKFLHQLVSSQLDLDRMDYLNRDSFFTGVSEGVISFDRIIKMLNVVNDRIVVEEKGIYSVEKFLIARRLMYWQVYLHKTVIAAETMLTKILRRAKELALQGVELFTTPPFKVFLYNRITQNRFVSDEKYLKEFVKLDDHDINACIKIWADHEDKILSYLCQSFINRKLYRVEIQKEPIGKIKVEEVKRQIKERFDLEEKDMHYFVFTDTISNSAYKKVDTIEILRKDGSVVDITEASDNFNIEALAKTVEKYYLCSVKL
ncbi:HD domain-containing protein [Solitalea canadensis]|uniref:HD superfamily phosphohydrolase n=1 Tax=Solitalea canadensis (strain ATCC 29591 / DSM 3403 / JCM 21819 / LMG 8368 / NBRC 15130 / NCIMB 12057 / USAM 9D) TaxID=929556 RepID=H8KMZ8_SOLCM|nr:HD domain-containing protein [Solitalea canadensis]AFD09077.1 HD superfamily phosphohydrolase [Solitalea canadensis DSM 3403]